MSETNELGFEVGDDFLLDDIEDLPEFVSPPTGAYTVLLPDGIVDKEINDANYFDIKMVIQSVEEIDQKGLDENEVPPKVGDMFNLIFKKDNKFGVGNFKKFAKGIAEHYRLRTVGEVREKAKGVLLLVVVKRAWNKKAQRHNVNVERVQVI